MSEWSDPATVAALGAVVTTILGMIISAIGRRKLNDKADIAATAATVAAEKTTVADSKLDTIQEDSAKASANTNGHLSKIREELAAERARNNSLETSVLALTAILAAQRTHAQQPPPSVAGTRVSDSPVDLDIPPDRRQTKD